MAARHEWRPLPVDERAVLTVDLALTDRALARHPHLEVVQQQPRRAAEAEQPDERVEAADHEVAVGDRQHRAGTERQRDTKQRRLEDCPDATAAHESIESALVQERLDESCQNKSQQKQESGFNN